MKSHTITATVNVAYLNRAIDKLMGLTSELAYAGEGYRRREIEDIRADIIEQRRRLKDYLKRKQK